jgi:NAD(P) transhydrogenase subunit alpha
MRAAVPRESDPRETRVALVPETVARLVKAGIAVTVQSGAGERATHTDQAYRDAGAAVSDTPAEVWGADVVLTVREPRPDATGVDPLDLMREGGTLIGFLRPARNADRIERMLSRRVTAFSMDLIPRISRAQKMDALSSMSTVAGYKCGLLAADTIGRFFPLLMTAAGTIPPARVFVLGAGVAGLQAIATCRRLGAVVEAFDVRPAVREEVQSLGATFVSAELVEPGSAAAVADASGYAREQSEDFQRRERELLAKHVTGADVVIATAMVPDRPAPRLITAAMVEDMKPGSVIVDLAAEMGGNCELTRPGESVVRHGVTIEGPLDLVCAMPVHASQMYSRNLSTFLLHLVKDGALHFDFEDEIVRASCVAHDGRPAPRPVAATTRS